MNLRRPARTLALAILACTVHASVVHAQQVSSPVTLQWFESSWKNIEHRAPDLFNAGYGALWTPPPGRSIYLPQGGGVGYDPYDRFDLGSPRDPTLYGTQNGYVGAIRSVQKFGANVYVDFVHHHVGSLDLGINGYTYPDSLIAQGAPYLHDRSDYPGFELSDPNSPVNTAGHRDTYAALYGANAGQTPYGDVYNYWFRLGENLVTIDLAHDREYVRSPVPGNAQNIRQAADAWAIPTTTILPNGQVGASTILRQGNVAKESNRALYPDLDSPGRTIIDNGVAYIVHDFNLANPMAGDPVAESTSGYMMRYAQWLTQVIGVDGLRIDAARHVPLGVYNSDFNPDSLDVRTLIDRAIAGSSNRTYLDGTKHQPSSFQEVFDYDANFLKTFVRKSAPAGDTTDPNRDVLDFSMWSAMATNMTGNGTQNNWFNIRSASLNAAIYNTLDPNIANNGANGIGFVYNHDEGVTPPGSGGSIVLDNVAHAWVLMRPGNAYVYYRSNEFDRSNESNFFLKQGRGDALGGQYGSVITTLLDLRNSYGRGDFVERYIDNAFAAPADQKSAIYVFERKGAALVGLNVGYNAGSTARTVNTSFQPGQWLEEGTGNWQDPSGAVRHYAVVQGNGQTTIDIPWNNAGNGNKGYVVYGLPRPRGTFSLTNSSGGAITQVLHDTQTAATNGTARITDVSVITGDSVNAKLATNAVTLNGGSLGTFRDFWADGNAALLKVDEGLDTNGNGHTDNPSSDPSNATKYGFETFATTNQPGYGSATGNGLYVQTVDASKLSEGYHYLTARAWRAPRAGEAEVFQDFRQTIYVDRLAPISTLDSTDPLVNQAALTTRDVRIKSTDGTANAVNVLFDVPTSLSDAQVLSLVNTGNAADAIDEGLFGKTQTNVGSGNHTVVSVTYEITGRYTINRYPGQSITTGRGLGLGDTNFDNAINASDVTGFESVLYSNRTASPQFNAAGDLNGNGVVDTNDLLALPARYATLGATGATSAAVTAAFVRRADVNGNDVTDASDIDFLFAQAAQPTPTDRWLEDLNVDGVVTNADVDVLVKRLLATNYGDANLNHTVDFTDLLALARDYGRSAGWAGGDFTGDGAVNFSDLLVLAKNYGVTANASAESVAAMAASSDPNFATDWALAEAVTPEPAGLAALGIFFFGSRRRGRR